MSAITLDTDATGQLTIDMPAGPDRSRLISTLKSGKYGPAGRNPNAHVTYADLAAGYAAAAAGARVDGDAAAAERYDAAARRMRDTSAIVASIGAIGRAAKSGGSDVNYSPGKWSQREPITDADLIDTASALGNTWAVACYRAAGAVALDMDALGNPDLFSGRKDDGTPVPDQRDGHRKLTPANVKTLTVKLPAVRTIAYGPVGTPATAPEATRHYGPFGIIEPRAHATVSDALAADVAERAERDAAERAARLAESQARWDAERAERDAAAAATKSTDAVSPAPAERAAGTLAARAADDAPRCPASYCGRKIRINRDGTIGAHRWGGGRCARSGTEYAAKPAAPVAEPAAPAAPAPVADVPAEPVAEPMAPPATLVQAIVREAGMYAAHKPLMHVHEIGHDTDCKPHTGRNGASFYRHTLAENADQVTCPVCRFLNALDAPAEPVAEPVADDAPESTDAVSPAPAEPVADVPAEPVAVAEPAAPIAGRWVMGARMNGDLSGRCGYCGTGYGNGGNCAPVACMLCDTVQCHSNGSGNGRCKCCHRGFLPGWSGTRAECGRTGCDAPAVADGPRGPVCRECAETIKIRVSNVTHTVAGYAAHSVAERDASAAGTGRRWGAEWMRWRFVADAPAEPVATAPAAPAPVAEPVAESTPVTAPAPAEPVADDAPAEPVAEPAAADDAPRTGHVWTSGAVMHTWCGMPHPLPAGHIGWGWSGGSPFRSVVHGGPRVTYADLITCTGCNHLLTCRADGCAECERVAGAPIIAAAPAPVAEPVQAEPVAADVPAEPVAAATVTAPNADNVTTWQASAPAEPAAQPMGETTMPTTTPAPAEPVAEPVATAAPAEPVAATATAATAAPARVAVRDRGDVDGWAFTVKPGSVNRAAAKEIKRTLYAERVALGGTFHMPTDSRTVSIVPADDAAAPADWSPVLARVAELLGDALADA
jgi:hypothetical protein